MKILLLNGSPRPNGNTAAALDEMEAVFAAEGLETERVQVGNRVIRGCIACGKCAGLGRCVFDDLVNELAPKLEACDGLVVGSPVYYASANATLVALLTRLFYSTPFDKTMKVGAAVAAARRGGLSSTFDELNKFFTISGMPVASSQYWNSIHGRLPDEAARTGTRCTAQQKARPGRTPRGCRPCAPWPGTWPSWSRASPWAGRNTACRSGRSLCAPTSSAESHTRRNPWNQSS